MICTLLNSKKGWKSTDGIRSLFAVSDEKQHASRFSTVMDRMTLQSYEIRIYLPNRSGQIRKVGESNAGGSHFHKTSKLHETVIK